MVILETPVFTGRVTALLSDEDYRKLQLHLIARPHAGSLIPGGGGLRKLRWSTGQKGKRGGLRFIYYWAVGKSRILMLMVYAKSETGDLTLEQLKILRKVVKEEFK
jgi:hypothetical protein